MKYFNQNEENWDKTADNQYQDVNLSEMDYCYGDNQSQIDLCNKIFMQQLQQRENESESDTLPSRKITAHPESSDFHFQNTSHHYVSEPSSKSSEKNNPKRQHLTRKRRRGNKKSKLQNSTKFYYLKNFLQFGKTPHISYLKRQKGVHFLRKNQIMREILNKKNANALSTEEYVRMYSIPQLEKTWKKFFASKYLYQYLMISRATQEYRRVFIHFMHRFQEAFIEKKFEGIDRSK